LLNEPQGLGLNTYLVSKAARKKKYNKKQGKGGGSIRNIALKMPLCHARLFFPLASSNLVR